MAAVEAGLRTGTIDGIGDGQSEGALAELQLQAARKLRQLLSTNRELLIQEVRAYDAQKKLSELLSLLLCQFLRHLIIHSKSDHL